MKKLMEPSGKGTVKPRKSRIGRGSAKILAIFRGLKLNKLSPFLTKGLSFARSSLALVSVAKPVEAILKIE